LTLRPSAQHRSDAARGDYVALWIGGQLFGVPILQVGDVFAPGAITRVPMAGSDVAGILNLRGRILTAISMRSRLGLPPLPAGHASMAVGVEVGGESYGLIVDSVGDVLSLDETTYDTNPANLDPLWARVSAGVHRLEGRLMVVLDVDRLLAPEPGMRAA